MNNRNSKCPCGSGHKYKKCCGAAPTAEQRERVQKLIDLFRGRVKNEDSVSGN